MRASGRAGRLDLRSGQCPGTAHPGGVRIPGAERVFNRPLDRVHIQVQVDLRFGDVVTSAAVMVDFPTLLDLPALC